MPQADLQQLCDKAHALGYAGIEPRIDWKHGHGVEVAATDAERLAIRDLTRREDIAICCVAVSSQYANLQTAAQNVENTHREIDLAADVGSTRLRVFGGGYEPADRDAAFESVISSLKAVADHAAERGVVVCLETHDSWCTPGDVVTVMQEVNHPAIAVNWDAMHTNRLGNATMAEAFETLRPWIRHVHVHDGAMRDGKLVVLPMGTGEYDHVDVLRLLKSIDYNGFLSGEWIGAIMEDDFFANHLEPEIKALRQMEASLS